MASPLDDLVLLMGVEDDMLLVSDEYDDILLMDDLPHAQHYEEYKGPYVVTPILYDDQELRTRDRVMIDNLTVREIPIVQTTNPYGGNTVVIG